MCLAIPGKVLRVDGLEAEVEMFGLVRRVYTALVPDAQPGEWLLVHVGAAIERVEPERAAEILGLLEEIHRLEAMAEAAESGATTALKEEPET